jgi:acyl carrier protein
MSTETIVREGGAAEVVRRMLADRSIDRAVSPNSNLSDLGLTSFDMVELVLSLESRFDLSIPEAHITPSNFRTVAAIDSLLASLQG